MPETLSGVDIEVDGASVLVDARSATSPMCFLLTGATTNGSFMFSGDCEANVNLSNLNLISKEGAAMCFSNTQATNITVADGTESHIIIKACKDTVNHKPAAIYAADNLHILGKGILKVRASGNGCKGIATAKSLIFSDATLEVATTGDNLGVDTTRVMGPPPFGAGGPPNFDEMPEEAKAFFEQLKKEGKLDENGRPKGGFGPGGPRGMRPGGMGPGGFPGGRPMQMNPGGFPGGPGGPGGMPPFGKQKYLGTCKGIKAGKTITINSGHLNITTESRGAEGMEGKRGVTINGGKVFVKAMDDAINANGPIVFNGGETTAWSISNDAVDANHNAEGAITINGGQVLAYSQNGPPEEGLDCDFSPIVITGGTAFSIGAGMGEMPSVPTEATAKQPTVLFIGLELKENEPVEIYDAKDKEKPLLSIPVLPFDYQGSSSLFTMPQLEKGHKYILKNGNMKKNFNVDGNFTIIR